MKLLYTISELLIDIKENIGIADIVIPVDDAALIRRLQNSALKSFSQVQPRIKQVLIDSKNVSELSQNSYMGYVEYEIPAKEFQDTTILAVLDIDPGGIGGTANMYMPSLYSYGADSMLEAISDITLASSIGANIAHAPTFQFEMPNKLKIYNGWFGGFFVVTLALSHAINLSTIEPGAMDSFKEVCRLDIQEFLYNKLKRIKGIDTGAGQFQLEIDDWADSGERKREMLKEWHQSGSNLDVSTISYF